MIDWKTTTVCCCANPVCLEKGCQLQAYQTFPSVDIKYIPVAVPDERKAEVERARADERAAIVAWLRADLARCSGPVWGTLKYTADAIENGEHLKGEDR